MMRGYTVVWVQISNEQKWDMAYDRMKYLYETLQYESLRVSN